MTDSERSYSGTAVAAVLLAMMVAGVVYRYWPSDERAIRRHLVNLAEVLSFPLTESREERLTRLTVLREYFAEDARIGLDDRTIASREEIIQQLTVFQPPPGGITVEFADIEIVLAEGDESATVTLAAKLSSTDLTGKTSSDERVADVLMRKVDGDWVIATATFRAPSA